MKSRGLYGWMGERARRSLALFWTALLLCSLVLQYLTFASPAPALAVHDKDLFELDGNVENQAAAGDDWNAVFNTSSGAFQTTFITDEINGNADKYFTGGDSKDIDNLSSWAWTTVSQPQDKNDIEDAYAAAYHADGDLIVYFGLDRYASNGDAQVGFWFLKGSFGLTGGPDTGGFSGLHTVGDVLVQIDFQNGGASPILRVYEWVGSGGNTSGTLDLVSTGGSCATTGAGDLRCAIASTADTNPDWAYDDKGAAGASNDIPAGGMVEGGINLTQLGLDSGCFASFVAETRSSQSPTSTLSDFASGSFSLCSKPNLSTQVRQDGNSLGSVGTINKGESVTDHAALTGDSGTVTGSVKFYVCGPNAGSTPDCSSGGTQVGGSVTLSGGAADSAAFTPTQVGFYCFRAEYTPAAGSKYLATSHTNATTECFQVIPANVTIHKTAGQSPVSAGSPISFTISWGNSGPGLATSVVVSDDLPTTAGLDWSIDSSTGSGSTCSISGAVGAEVLTCNVGSIPGNTATHGTVTLVSGTTSASCGVVDNTGSITSGNDGSGSSEASVTVQCPDITVTKEPDQGDAGSEVSAGETATFSITVKNLGPGTATGVTLDDPLPDGIDWTDDSASCSITPDVGTTGQVLSCTFGTLAANATATVTLTGTTDKADCGALHNTATVDATNEPASAGDNNSDTGRIDVLCAQIDISKTADDGTVSAGDQVGFTVTVTNNGDGTAFGVSASDPLPAGFAWSIESQDGSWTLNAGTLTYAAASLAAGASSSVHVVATSDAADCGLVTNTATVTTTSDGSDEASASVTVQCPDLHVDKSAGASPINAGDTASFTITVTNDGAGTAHDVTLSDTLPGGIAWTEGSASCSITAGVLACDFGDLAPGASASVTVSGPTDAADCATIPNTATVAASNESAADAQDNSDSAQVVVQCPDLHVDKSADHSPVSAGDTASFTITVTNDGPGVAYDVTLSDTLPAGIPWTENSASCSITAGVLACDFGDLASGASASVTVSGKTSPAVCGDVPNTATVAASNESAADAQDNSDSATVVVNCPDLHVDKSADNSPISAGETASFTITVTNDGAGTADDVTLSDTLPTGVTWTEDSASCSITAGVLSCNFGDLAPGASASVTVSGETDATDCGTIPNTATVAASNESAQDALDNSDSAEVVVDCPAIVITKTADDPEVNATDQVGFTITVTNNGAGTAKGVTVSDTLPTDPGLAWTISPASAAWSIAGGVLSFGPADLAAGASVSVHIVSITTPATCGAVDNTATVTTSNGGGDEDSSQITVLCPDVRISKAADVSPILAGQTASYTITVWNDGPGTAYDVTVSDTLPAGIAWTENSEACSITAGVLSCDFGDLAEGDQASVTVSGPTTAEDCGALPNLATVAAANEPVAAQGNNSDDALITVQCAAIDLVKTAGTAADGEEYVTEPGDVLFTYVVTNTGTADLENVVVVDDNATPAVTSDDVTLTCPKATLAVGESMTCTATLPVDFGVRTNVAEVTANPVLDEEGQVSDTDDAVVRVPQLTIEKSFTGNTGGTTPGGDPQAKEGDVLTFTLAYDLTDGPVTDGIITDVVPAGLEYVDGSASDNAEFTFDSYNPATRTLTWLADEVTADGSVTYDVHVAVDAAKLPQPLVNLATIDSGQTAPDDDTADVFVAPPPKAETGTPRITPPPTSTVDEAPSRPGNGLLLLLIAIAGLTLVVGTLVPAPARARRRSRRG